MSDMTAAASLKTALERRNAEFGTMVEIGKALTSTLQLDEVLHTIMDRISNLLAPDAWRLLLAEGETGDFTYEIAVVPDAADKSGQILKPGAGFAGWVAEHGEPLLVTEVASDTRFSHLATPRCGSVLCVPVKIQDRILGVVELECGGDVRRYCASDLELLTAIADFAAIAIENARVHEQVRKLAVTDELTGLWNARRFNDLLEYEVERVRRYGGAVSLIFMDLDYFKQINDSQGHLVGSRILSEVGRLMGRSIRSVDSAARFGGDEFVLMFPNTSKEWGHMLADRLWRVLREAEFRSDNGSRLLVTGSFGVATYPDDAENARELLVAADQAMYRVKEAARDAVEVAPALPRLNGGDA